MFTCLVLGLFLLIAPMTPSPDYRLFKPFPGYLQDGQPRQRTEQLFHGAMIPNSTRFLTPMLSHAQAAESTNITRTTLVNARGRSVNSHQAFRTTM